MNCARLQRRRCGLRFSPRPFAALTSPSVEEKPSTAVRRWDRKFPLYPGYAVIGDVDALGPDVSGVTVGERVGVLAVTDGKSLKLYGTSSCFLFDKRPYLEDWAALFKLLEERKIKPVIMQKFPLLEAAKANQLRFLCAAQTWRPGPYAILSYKLTVPKRATTCSRLCRLCSGKNSSQ